MNIKPIKTHRIERNDSLQDILDRYIGDVSNESILVITSKILSVIQGRLVQKDTVSKYALICQESQFVLDSAPNQQDLYLTIKDGILIPSAGIDESNADDSYILYPENIQETAGWIWSYLRERNKIEKLGVLITDSHTTIMRRGTTGIALGWCGFAPLFSYINKRDLYDKPLRVTQLNILDSLATAAVFVMGEGNEQTPFALIQNAPKISFLDRPPSAEEEESIIITQGEDLYAPLLASAKWLAFG